MARKLFIQTHGCQMNEYDSTRMVDLLESTHNLEPTDNPEDADVLLLNTCSIREKAQEKVFHQLGRWKRLKERNPELIIGVGGCVASQEGEAIQGLLSETWSDVPPTRQARNSKERRGQERGDDTSCCSCCALCTIALLLIAGPPGLCPGGGAGR